MSIWSCPNCTIIWRNHHILWTVTPGSAGNLMSIMSNISNYRWRYIFLSSTISCVIISGVPRGGFGYSNPPKFQMTSKNFAKINPILKTVKNLQNLERQHKKKFEKSSKILKPSKFAIALHFQCQINWFSS